VSETMDGLTLDATATAGKPRACAAQSAGILRKTAAP
jgi:hypothetical protein